jgi:carbamoyl-phosphate synthase large subunit
MLGSTLADLGFPGTYHLPPPRQVAVKAPVFSSEKLGGAEIALGPEMRSTGEAIGVDRTLPAALYKAFLAAGMVLPPRGDVLLSVPPRAHREAVRLARRLAGLGMSVRATPGTAAALQRAGIPCRPVLHADAVKAIRAGEVGAVVNVPSAGHDPSRPGFQIRRAAAERRVICLTTLETAWALADVLEALQHEAFAEPRAMSGPAPLA